MNRRSFIQVSGLVGGGLMMSIAYPLLGKRNRETAVNETIKLNTFLTIDTTGQVTFLLTKQEMGQGVETGLAMILADELGADWDTLKIEQLDYSRDIPGYQDRFGIMETGGSMSVSSTWDVLRKAGATAREMLLTAAGTMWNVDTTTCVAHKGKVVHTESGRIADFGSLAEAASKIGVASEVVLKNKSDFQLIGKPVKSKKTARVIKGDPIYSIDGQLPGMVYASILRCPVVGGKVVSYNDQHTKQVAGVIDVVKIEGRKDDTFHWQFESSVAVIANSTWAAIKGRKLLEVVWDYGSNGDKDLEYQRTLIRNASAEELTSGVVIGNTEYGMNEAAQTLEVAYEVPFLSHALMEPLNAIAHVSNERCDVWAGTQSPQYTAVYLAQVLNISLDKIVVHTHQSGGGFGRRFFSDFVAEAAILSQQLGLPVKAMWTREDEIQHGRYHPFRWDIYKAGIDAYGDLTALEFKGISTWFRPADSLPVYPIQRLKEEYKIVSSIVNTGPWRSVAAHPAALGKECMIDEVAHLLKKDPIDFRLILLKKEPVSLTVDSPIKWFETRNRNLIPKFINVLQLLKEKSGWGNPLPKGRGRGVAVHEFGESVCGQVVELSVDENDYTINKIYCVIDCGLVINPHLAQGQVEGSIIWALSAIMYEAVDIKNGRVQQSNFHDNKVLRMDSVPEMDIMLIGNGDTPGRVGEAAVPPLAPAVLNAMFNACGKRIRKVPVTKADIENSS